MEGDVEELKTELCNVVKHLFQRGLILPYGGNVSARLPGSREVWITPSGKYKGKLKPEDLVKISLEGEVLEAPEGLKPSIEYPLHISIYKRRLDVNAVVHTHSPYTTGLTIAGLDLEPVTSEAAIILEKVRLVPFAPPGSWELAEKAAGKAEEGVSALLLQGHGVVGLGRNLLEAMAMVETLEGIALTQLSALLAARRIPSLPWKPERGEHG